MAARARAPTNVPLDELTKQAFDFQAQRVAADKQFALDLVDIWTQSARKVATSPSPSQVIPPLADSRRWAAGDHHRPLITRQGPVTAAR